MISELGAVQEDEIISRYIFEKKHFKREQGIVHAAAFEPRKFQGRERLETSVFRVKELTNDENWNIGDWVAKRRKPSLKARADLEVRLVTQIGLSVVPETSQHYRHADIADWKDDELENLNFQAELALVSTLKLKEEN